MNEILPPELKSLHELYTSPTSSIFLAKNVDQILQFTRTKSNLKHLSRIDIISYQNRIAQLSRDFERRILQSRVRHISTRRWIVWSPKHIMCGKPSLDSERHS
jgi:hypothetical protein